MNEEERIKQIKEHLLQGKLISEFEDPDNTFEFMKRNANKFSDIVFTKTSEVE